MHISERSGGAMVIASGMVTAFFGAPIDVVLREEGWHFTLHLSFESDASVVGVDVRSALEPDRLALTCVNFDSSDGRGSAQPVLCGRRGEAYLFVHFRVFRFGNTQDRTVHYTFFLAEEQALGFVPYLAAEPSA